MPVYTGKGVGALMAAVASVNRVFLTGNIANGATFFTKELATPGMTRLTWLVTQTAGNAKFLATPQIALRITNVATPQLVWIDVAAPTATTLGVPLVLQFNTVCCEAMRLKLVSQAPAPPPIDLLSASGFLSASA